MSDITKDKLIDALRDFKEDCMEAGKIMDAKNPAKSLTEANMTYRMGLLSKVFALLDELDKDVQEEI